MKKLQASSTPSATLDHQLSNFLEVSTKWVYSVIELLDTIKPHLAAAATTSLLSGRGNHSFADDLQEQAQPKEKRIFPFADEARVLTNSNQPEQGLQNFSNDLADATKEIAKISGAFSELHPGLKKVQAAFDIVAGLQEGQQGFTDILKASTEQSVSSLFDDVTKIIGGAGQAGAAGSVLGPEGTLAAFTIYTVVETMDVARQQERQIAERNKQLKKQADRSLSTFVMSEKDAGNLVQDVRRLQPVTKRNWQLPYNPGTENAKKYGNHAYDLTFDVPVATADALKPHYPLDYKEEEYYPPKKKSYLEQTFDLQQRLNNAGLTNGIAGFRETAATEIAEAKKYDLVHHTKTVEMVYSATQESLGNLLTQANGRRTFKYQNGQAINDTCGAKRQPGENSRTVVVNVTRPLIEHFTINVKDTKEGVADLRRQVEEVLLEILSSTNMK